MAEELVHLNDVETLSERVVRILGQNPGTYTLQGTNTYLLGTGKRRILVDTGEGRMAYGDLLGSFLRDKGIEIERIVITHWHHDHTGGVGQVFGLLNKRVPVHKVPNATHDPAELDGVSVEPLADGAVLSVDGATLHVLHTPGHTDDHICLYLAEENAVFSADAVLGQGTTVFENLRRYMSSLQRIVDTNCSLIYPGHGPVITSGTERVKEYISHRLAREQQVIDVLSRMGVATVEMLVEDIYAMYPKAVHAAAAAGLMLHLDKLKEEGRVKEVGEAWTLTQPKM